MLLTVHAYQWLWARIQAPLASAVVLKKNQKDILTIVSEPFFLIVLHKTICFEVIRAKKGKKIQNKPLPSIVVLILHYFEPFINKK